MYALRLSWLLTDARATILLRFMDLDIRDVYFIESRCMTIAQSLAFQKYHKHKSITKCTRYLRKTVPSRRASKVSF